MSIGKRLNALLKSKGVSAARLADQIGVKRQNVYHWLNDRNDPNNENLESIAKFFDVDEVWLRTGKTTVHYEGVNVAEDIAPESSEYVFIPEYELVFGCSSEGVDAPEWIESKDVPKAAYRLDFFHEHNTRPGRCMRVQAHGDSMEPLILDGDKVLICRMNEGDPIIDGRIYAISYGGALRIKRLFTRAGGGLVIHSENPTYKDESLTGLEADELIRIHGMVIDRSGTIK